MFAKRFAVAAATGLILIGMAAGSASAETRFDRAHPRQEQVLHRAHRLDHKIAVKRAEGQISAAKAVSLRHQVKMVMRKDHRLSRLQGGHITRAEQVRLNHRVAKITHRVPG